MDRPVVTAIVGYFVAPFGVIGHPKVVTLAEAAIYHRLGFMVFVDPESEADLARWDQLQRSQQTKRKWYEAP